MFALSALYVNAVAGEWCAPTNQQKYLATLGGIVFLSHQAGAILGAWLGGLIFDTYGNYEIAWWISVLLGVIAFLFHIFINERAFNNNPELKTV